VARPLPLLLAVGAVAALLAGCGGDEGTTTTVTVTETSAVTTTAPSPAATAAVVQLQSVMTDLGYYDGPIDGVYGAATTDGVKAMQEDLGVEPDGVYGPETHDALKGKGASIVASVQTTLQTYGYYDGEIDGEYGDSTTEAVKALQTDLGVTADGKIGPETIDAFNKAVEDGTITPKT
jgi:peptidoglycan hydrolase-like protein with peptidoglycan-binding domain